MESRTEPGAYLTAFGNQLIEVHLWLREELARLRDDVDLYLEGNGRRPRDLRVHCLAFCSALERHHGGEDVGPFPVLAAQVPELRPVIEELQRDHHLVAATLRSLEHLVDGLAEDTSPDEGEADRVRRELDTLAALLETHFGYEEKRLVSALNALSSLTPDGSRPDFLLTEAELGGSVPDDPRPTP